MQSTREESPVPSNPCDETADMEQSRANILAEYGADAPNWFVDQMVQLERMNKQAKRQQNFIAKLFKLKTNDNE